MIPPKEPATDVVNQPDVSAPASSDIRLRKEKEELVKFRAKLEKRKQDFRLYLEQTGIIDKLSKALLRMFEEPDLPEDPITYFKKLVTSEDYDPEVEELDRLSEEIHELKGEITGITEENKKLRAALGMPLELIQSPAIKIAPSESEVPGGGTVGVARDKGSNSQQAAVRTPSANLKDRKKKP